MEFTGFGSGFELTQKESLSGLFEKAETALAEKRPEDAVACFDKVLRADPFNTKALRGISRAHWEQGKTEDALNGLTRALELNPNELETILECSRVFQALGKRDYAQEVLESFIERNPYAEEARCELESLGGPVQRKDPEIVETAQFFRKQGTIQFERGNINHAVACLEMAIESDPEFAEAHNDLGVIHYQNGNIEAALKHLYSALELDPEDPEILGNSARALSKAGEIDSAIEMFRQYLRLRPQDQPAWDDYENLVRCSALPARDPKASSSKVSGIYTETAKKLMDAKDFAGATEAVATALKISPEATQAMFIMAALHMEIGQRDEAVTLLEQALAIDPASADCKTLLKAIRNGKGGAAKGAQSK